MAEKVVVLKDFCFRARDFVSCGIRYDNPVLGKSLDGKEVRAHEKPLLYLVLRLAVPGTASMVTMLRGEDDIDTMTLYAKLLVEIGVAPDSMEQTLEELQVLLKPMPPVTPIQ